VRAAQLRFAASVGWRLGDLPVCLEGTLTAQALSITTEGLSPDRSMLRVNPGAGVGPSVAWKLGDWELTAAVQGLVFLTSQAFLIDGETVQATGRYELGLSVGLRYAL